MTAKTQGDLLEVWRRSMDAGYVRPLEDAGYGFGLEVYEAHAAMVARVSTAVERSVQAMFILPWSGQTDEPASGAARSTATLTVTRSAAYHLRLVFTPWVQVEDGYGRRFAVTVNTTLVAGSPGPLSLPVVAVRPGRSYDVRTGELDAIVQAGSGFANVGATVTLPLGAEELTDTGSPDCLVPAHVGQYMQFTAGPNLGRVRRVTGWRRNPDGTSTVVLTNDDAGSPVLVAEAGTAGWRMLRWAEDLGVEVTNSEAASGGRSDVLDMLGRERSVYRSLGETDDQYRQRVATLPDVVSPNAIQRTANRLLAPYSERCYLREVGDETYLPGFFWDVDAWDYDFAARPADRYKLLLDYSDMRGFFLLGVPPMAAGEFGFALDEGFQNAWDEGFLDGFPVEAHAVYKAIWDSVEQARAGGVGWELYVERVGYP